MIVVDKKEKRKKRKERKELELLKYQSINEY